MVFSSEAPWAEMGFIKMWCFQLFLKEVCMTRLPVRRSFPFEMNSLISRQSEMSIWKQLIEKGNRRRMRNWKYPWPKFLPNTSCSRHFQEYSFLVKYQIFFLYLWAINIEASLEQTVMRLWESLFNCHICQNQTSQYMKINDFFKGQDCIFQINVDSF